MLWAQRRTICAFFPNPSKQRLFSSLPDSEKFRGNVCRDLSSDLTWYQTAENLVANRRNRFYRAMLCIRALLTSGTVSLACSRWHQQRWRLVLPWQIRWHEWHEWQCCSCCSIRRCHGKNADCVTTRTPHSICPGEDPYRSDDFTAACCWSAVMDN